jgi:tetratricopeptide (TPR) repeat protein
MLVPMRSLLGVALALVIATGSLAADAANSFASPGRTAPICASTASELPVSGVQLLDFGGYSASRVSQNSQAQRFFEQGLVFGWGFNFPEAVRSFRAATQLDPGCELCRWGIAWALGPSINHDMRQADRPVALDVTVQARVYAEPHSRERALIDALAARYAGSDHDRASHAYADAMRALAEQFAHDADIAVLAAEALMNAHPYDYWDDRGKARAWTPQVIALLERALRIAPEHPGAHHYRIHLFEESPQPEHALSSAEKLGALAPIVGHLVHMPSHIYFRLGRYRDAMQANAAAVQADRDYSAATGTESDYAVHNVHFLWASALWSGDSAAAERAAEQLAKVAARISDAGLRQHLKAAPVLTRVALAQWDALAATTAGVSDAGATPYLNGLTQFALGMAHAARNDAAAARTQLELLQRSYRDTRKAALRVKNIHRASDVLEVARLQLQSAIVAMRGGGGAVRHARAAVRAEDRLAVDDPPVWVLPSRHLLGAALLRAGAAAEAAAVYRADLRRHPNNPVALNGLAAAQRRLQLSFVSDSLSALRSAPSLE